MNPKQVFVREATGLVREVSIWDAFWYNNWTAGGPLGSLLWLSVYPVWFPQADLVLALILTGIYSTFIGAMYALNVVVMPRSGSDYVFVSRALFPAIGLGFSVNLVFWIMMLNSWNVYLSYSFVSQAMYSIGAMMGSMSLVSVWGSIAGNTSGVLVLGVVIYVISTGLVLIGLRRLMKYFQRGVNIISIVSFVIIIAAGLIYTNQDFISRFNSSMALFSGTADPYHDIITLATSLGYVEESRFDWYQTIVVSVLFWLFSLWPMASAWMGGEVKGTGSVRAQFLAMSGGQWFTCFAGAFLMALWQRAFGRNWLAALGYVALNHPDKIPQWLAGAAPYYQLGWVNILLGNVWIAAFVSIAWVLQAIYLVPPLINACSRHLFAWSFDRVAPSKFSEVNDRLHSPILAISLIGVVTLIGYFFTVYTTYLIFVVGAPLGVMWSLLVVSIASIMFRWRRKDIYESSRLAKLKFAGVPLYPIIAILALGTLVTMIYSYAGPLNNVVLGGLSVSITEGAAIMFGIGIVGYYLAKWIQERRGVSLELVFKEIPPE